MLYNLSYIAYMITDVDSYVILAPDMIKKYDVTFEERY